MSVAPLTQEGLAEFIAIERREAEIIRRYYRVYGWRAYIFSRELRWYGIRMILAERLAVTDEGSGLLFRLEETFIGLGGVARVREQIRLAR